MKRPVIPVILDTDNALGMPVRDIDDGLALAIGLTAHSFDVRAIIASACNCTAMESAWNTKRLLAAFDAPHIPIGLGRPPLSEDRTPHHAYLEKRSREDWKTFWKTPPAPAPVLDLPDGPAVMVETLQSAPDPVVVVCLGSLTCLAAALEMAPEIRHAISGVLHMGGRFAPRPGELSFVWETGDIPAGIWETTLRFNTWYDPDATLKVLASGIPMRFLSANVTSHVFLRPGRMAALARCPEGPRKRFLMDALSPWMDWSVKRRQIDGIHLHDPLAILSLMAPDLFGYRTMAADGPSFLETGELFPEDPPGDAVLAEVAVHVDIDAAETALFHLLEGAMKDG